MIIIYEDTKMCVELQVEQCLKLIAGQQIILAIRT